jgi:hypothetical protein
VAADQAIPQAAVLHTPLAHEEIKVVFIDVTMSRVRGQRME